MQFNFQFELGFIFSLFAKMPLNTKIIFDDFCNVELRT